jgi:hypothetical protein
MSDRWMRASLPVTQVLFAAWLVYRGATWIAREETFYKVTGGLLIGLAVVLVASLWHMLRREGK